MARVSADLELLANTIFEFRAASGELLSIRSRTDNAFRELMKEWSDLNKEQTNKRMKEWASNIAILSETLASIANQLEEVQDQFQKAEK